MSEPVILESRSFDQQYDNLMVPEPVKEPMDHSKYLMPTLIILPLVISAILVLASKAQWSIKIITTILIIISVIMYNLKSSNIDVTSYLKPKQY